MSEYDLAGGMAYEGAQMTAARALQRANAITIDSSTVRTPSTQPTPVVSSGLVSVQAVYPPYVLGYNAGDPIVTLPSQQANPPPTLHQYMITSPHTYDTIRADQLPPVLFRIEPFEDTFQSIVVPQLYDAATNQQVVTQRGARLRYFSFLPRYIAHDVPGALLEFWFRLDYRLEMNDILMRIESGSSVDPTRPAARNNLNMRRLRLRAAITANSWNDCRTWPVRSDVEYVGKLTPAQICLNTSMSVDTTNQRLLKPVFADLTCSQQTGWVDSGLPFDYFIANLVTTIPTRRMIAAIVLRHRTQDLAVLLGLHPSPDNFKSLSDEDAPVWWSDRKKGEGQAVGRKIDEIDAESHEEWMESEVGTDMNVGLAKRASTRGWVV